MRKIFLRNSNKPFFTQVSARVHVLLQHPQEALWPQLWLSVEVPSWGEVCLPLVVLLHRTVTMAGVGRAGAVVAQEALAALLAAVGCLLAEWQSCSGLDPTLKQALSWGAQCGDHVGEFYNLPISSSQAVNPGIGRRNSRRELGLSPPRVLHVELD